MTVGSGFQVYPAGETVAVLVYQQATAVTFYFDQACTLAATAPSITTTTVFYVLNPGAYSISLKVGGVEMATPDGNQLTVGLSSGSLPTLTPQAQAAGATGVARLIAGTNTTLSPLGGTGTVTINSTASGLPTASAAGEVPVSTGAGTTYAASSGAVNVLGSGVTSYTLQLSDINGTVITTSSSPVTVTIPTNVAVAMPVPSATICIQGGTGLMTVTTSTNVTLNGVTSSGSKASNGQYLSVGCYQESANTWFGIASGAASSGSGGNGVVPQPSGTFVMLTMDNSGSSGAFAENIEYDLGFYVAETVVLNALSARFYTSGGTGSVVRLGLRNDGTGSNRNLPGSLIIDGGTAVSSSGSDPTVTLGSATTLTPGRYWLAFVNQGGTVPTWRTGVPGPWTFPCAISALSAVPASFMPYLAYNDTTVSGALPTNPTTPGVAGPTQGVAQNAIPDLSIGF